MAPASYLIVYCFSQISYILNEEDNWAINIENVRNQLLAAREVCEPRVMVVINPGNPTGQSAVSDVIVM